jgi:hypothetical protein
MSEQCPRDTRIFVRQRNRSNIVIAPIRKARQPSARPIWMTLQAQKDGAGAVNQHGS